MAGDQLSQTVATATDSLVALSLDRFHFRHSWLLLLLGVNSPYNGLSRDSPLRLSNQPPLSTLF